MTSEPHDTDPSPEGDDPAAGDDDPASRDVVSWVLMGLIVALLAVNLVNLLRPAAVEGLVGQPAPDFELPRLRSEKTVALKDYRGEVVVLDFWATWCPPCRRQMPRLRTLRHDDEVGDDLQILSINTDETVRGEARIAKVKGFLDERELNVTTLLDDGRVSRAYDVQSLPTLVVVGPEGRIQYAGTGVHSTETLISLVRKAQH